MANRVLLGNRGGDYGLFVSKPGTNVLTCDEEDMLLDSRRKEIVSNPLQSGSSTITFSGTSSAGNYLNSDTGDISFGVTYDYIPTLVYCFVDSGNNKVFPMYYENQWSNTITTNQAGEPIISTSSGYFGQSTGWIWADKIKIFASRYISQTGTIYGFSTGTHTVHWAVFPVGEAT
tara:strand:- start:1228 stop:1752 length:525 start_codon:yes stop_codon:yes gene_type:complete